LAYFWAWHQEIHKTVSKQFAIREIFVRKPEYLREPE
jgi:hypothetical protein